RAISHALNVYTSGDGDVLLSFPTRRSSDLSSRVGDVTGVGAADRSVAVTSPPASISYTIGPSADRTSSRSGTFSSRATATATRRSEEHTSELQSREKLVCRRLHEKKK